MDAERFDALTRNLSRSVHRRRALAGLLAGALGAALGRSASAQDKPPGGEPCDPSIPPQFSTCPVCYRCQQTGPTTGVCQPIFGAPCNTGPGPNPGCLICQQDPDQRPGSAICAPAPGTCAIAGRCFGAGNRNPSNPCQECNPTLNQTSWSAVPDGTACPDDGHPCTEDVCRGGSCRHDLATGQCLIDSACEAAGRTNPDNACQVCDPDQSTGQWSNVENGRPCDDGNVCTRRDECRNGSCTGLDPVVCAPSDQCHRAGECDPGSGLCSNPEAPDGTACNADDNACTRNDSCRAGVCQPGDPVVCEARGQCRVAGTCDADTGECDNPPAPDGAACDDGDPCTTDDRCVDGECAGTEKSCPGATECCRRPGNHLGQCVARQACENSDKPERRGRDASAARQESERGRAAGRGRERKRGSRRRRETGRR